MFTIPGLLPFLSFPPSERRSMSAAYYQLLPTRPDGDPPPSTPPVRVRHPPSFLSRLAAALPFQLQLHLHLQDRYRSLPKFNLSNRSKSLWSEPSKRPITLYAAGASAATLIFLALFVYQERMKEYIMDTFFGPAPPAACLRDSSAASSYVPWQPLTADDQLVYHCIKVPHPSEPPPLRAYQSLPSACRDAFFENGQICNHGSTTTFDLAWTWVNGSDALLHDAMAAAEDNAWHENAVGLQAGQKLYRCVLSLTRPLVRAANAIKRAVYGGCRGTRGAAEVKWLDVLCRITITAGLPQHCHSTHTLGESARLLKSSLP
jgi:hypothetical protein